MAILSCTRKNNSFHVSFGTDTSIHNASRIKSALSKLFTYPVESYHMDLSAVTDTDITFIQLLFAFNEKAKKLNRKMIILDLPRESKFIFTASECGVDVKSLFEIKDG